MGEGNKVVASRALTVFVTGTGEGGEAGKGGVFNPPELVVGGGSRLDQVL
jgi:hypothetical protein